MTTNRTWTYALLAASLTVTLATSGLIAGKPPKDPPPPTAPVSYFVTPVSIPGTSFYFNDHDEQAAVVGWDSDVGLAVAYLPWFSMSSAVYLDDPALGVVGIPEGWHTRSALGMNNLGAIVGNLVADDDPASLIRTPFLLDASPGGPPQMFVLGPFDSEAEDEVALQINDSGDIVIKSKKMDVVSLYVGNPGLYGNPAIPFEKLVLPAGWSVRGDEIMLSNRIGTSPAILTAALHDGVESRLSRMNIDGSGFEITPILADANGSTISWWGHTAGNDLNDLGDVAGAAFVAPANKGKLKNNLFGALWTYDTGEIISAGSDDALRSEWDWAVTNNDGDFLLSSPEQGAFDTLWHQQWSAANGAIAIADLIDTDDPNRGLFVLAHEITDHGTDGWPTIIAQGEGIILILDPVLNAGP